MARILIVDDEEQLAQMVSVYLTHLGHQVSWASDPAKGLQLARKEKPDLVIMDYHMPGGTGAHLFENFRRNKAFELVPVLFMSGSKPEAELLEEIASRARTAYLPKPVSPAALAETIEKLLKS